MKVTYVGIFSTNLINLENLILFFIEAIGKELSEIKGSKSAGAHFQVTSVLYWAMNRSSCGLIWPFRGQIVSPLFVSPIGLESLLSVSACTGL